MADERLPSVAMRPKNDNEKHGSGDGLPDRRQPGPRFLDRALHGVGRGRLRRLPRPHRCLSRHGLLHVVAEVRAEALPLRHDQRIEIPFLLKQLAHHATDDLMRVAEWHATPDEIVGDVGCQEKP